VPLAHEFNLLTNVSYSEKVYLISLNFCSASCYLFVKFLEASIALSAAIASALYALES
jgi:hypothetical protein